MTFDEKVNAATLALQAVQSGPASIDEILRALHTLEEYAYNLAQRTCDEADEADRREMESGEQ